MNNPVTSVRETDGERSVGSMSSCLWHAKEPVHCVTASFADTIYTTPSPNTHSNKQKYMKMHLHVVILEYFSELTFLPHYLSVDRIQFDTPVSIFQLSLYKQLWQTYRDPNITLS